MTLRSTIPSKVVLVGTLPVVLAGLDALLVPFDDFVVVGRATSAHEARVVASEADTDFVLVDTSTTDLYTPTLCRQLATEVQTASVVLLVGDEQEAFLRVCLEAGAAGLLPMEVTGDELVHTLRAMAGGTPLVDPRLSDRISTEAGNGVEEKPPHTLLTPREREVLVLLAKGLTSKEIASTLSLSTNTIRGYAQNVLTKLQAHNRFRAVEHARRIGLL